jgi:phosphate transport system substrate-binding protein
MTWLLLYPEYKEPTTAQALQGFVNWALNDGDRYAAKLGYIPLSPEIESRVLQTVQKAVVANK